MDMNEADRPAIPLQMDEVEVLRALIHGLRLRRIGDGWQFVGPHQEPEWSGVRTDLVERLARDGLVSPAADGTMQISESGEGALKASLDASLNTVLKWLRSNNSQKRTCS
jgi:hypothetical protein